MLIDIPNPEVVKEYLKNVSSATEIPDSSPPERGIVLLGYDSANNLVRRIQVTSDGKLVLWLG